jgi:hypothetical protein
MPTHARSAGRDRCGAQFSLTQADVAEQLLSKTSVPDEEQAGIDYFLLYGEILEARGASEEAIEKYGDRSSAFPV